MSILCTYIIYTYANITIRMYTLRIDISHYTLRIAHEQKKFNRKQKLFECYFSDSFSSI